tara:strand:- start:81 stop:236 length:156 start_codon:yes stop_codon:yes gene_type:complete
MYDIDAKTITPELPKKEMLNRLIIVNIIKEIKKIISNLEIGSFSRNKKIKR